MNSFAVVSSSQDISQGGILCGVFEDNKSVLLKDFETEDHGLGSRRIVIVCKCLV